MSALFCYNCGTTTYFLICPQCKSIDLGDKPEDSQMPYELSEKYKERNSGDIPINGVIT